MIIHFIFQICHDLKHSNILILIPYHLKQRILGKRGHLSNERGGQLVRELLNDHIKGIYLGHLSKENNYPELAYEAVKAELYGNPYSNDCRDFNMMVAEREQRSEVIEC